ncbi:CGNR zinc finger domain-containing protein [Streptomyces sp. NPDC087440]|uniref:CGNR zinc finger domain-containing protein n=1 Tax=Streptomyces sp. NPDC087440 TaxID=3365790 RepID=UPI0037F74DAC
MGARTEPPPHDRLPLTGEPLPLDLVNTTFIRGGVRGQLLDALGEPGDLDRWLALHRGGFSDDLARYLADPPPAGDVHLARFVELRHALRGLAGARARRRTPGVRDVQVVNAAVRLASRWSELDAFPAADARSALDARSAFVAVPRWPEPDPLLVALGEVAAQGVRLFTGEDAEKIRACPAPGCVLYFLKVPVRREWCTVSCGNRVRVARHSRRMRGYDGSAGAGG